MEFVVEKVSNMVFITDTQDIVWEAWDESEFTERKLKNAMKRLQKNHLCPITFERKF